MKSKWLVVLAAAMMLVALPAMAEVRFEGCFDPFGVQPCGFVGKGDVQLAFGWNNAGFQTYSEQIEFRWIDSTTATWQCSHYVKGELKQTQTKTSSQGLIKTTVFKSQRSSNQLLGWDLTGPVLRNGSSDQTGWGSCPGDEGEPNSGNSDWIYVEGSLEVSGSASLKACLGSTETAECRVIWIPPAE